MAITLAIKTKASLSTAAGANAAIPEPTATRPRSPGADHAHTTSIIDRAAVAVGAERRHVGRHDDGDRGADAKLKSHLIGYAERSEPS